MIAIGLDGFSKGWVAVTLDGDRRSIDFPCDISWLATQRFDRAAIDIPLGMNDDGRRACDQLARAKLRPHASRVFGGARRWLWQEFSDPDQANAHAKERGQTKVSRQLWHLGPKIMQVDAFVREHPSLDIRETHPELVFLRLNADMPLRSKHEPEGLSRRIELLQEHGFGELDTWLTRSRIGHGAKRVDVLDACAASLAARDISTAVPAGTPLRDSRGVPMQIWF